MDVCFLTRPQRKHTGAEERVDLIYGLWKQKQNTEFNMNEKGHVAKVTELFQDY